MEKTIVVHRTFEQLQPVIHVLEKSKPKKLSGRKLEKWAKALKGATVRSTFAGLDRVLILMQESGARILYAPWSKSGLNGQKDIGEILRTFKELPQSAFYEYRARPELIELRRQVDLREEFIASRIASTNRLVAAERAFGEQEDLEKLKAHLKDERLALEKKYDKGINVLAENIGDCRTLKAICGIEVSYLSAAKIAALISGPERFHSVSALWKYAGLDVRRGKSPKKTKGECLGFNPRLRVAIFQVVESIYKNRENPWRAAYEKFRAMEYENHDAKCPSCKTKDGHCTRRAQRRVAKEILKKFFLASGHGRSGYHSSRASCQEKP